MFRRRVPRNALSCAVPHIPSSLLVSVGHSACLVHWLRLIIWISSHIVQSARLVRDASKLVKDKPCILWQYRKRYIADLHSVCLVLSLSKCDSLLQVSFWRHFACRCMHSMPCQSWSCIDHKHQIIIASRTNRHNHSGTGTNMYTHYTEATII